MVNQQINLSEVVKVRCPPHLKSDEWLGHSYQTRLYFFKHSL